MKDEVILSGLLMKKYKYNNKTTNKQINMFSIYNYISDTLSKIPVTNEVFEKYEESEVVDIRCYKLSGISKKDGSFYSFYSIN